MSTSLTFQGYPLEIITHNGTEWIKGSAVCGVLGYKNPEKAISDIYERHKDEFTPSMVQKIRIPTNGGEQEVLAFSLRGAHLLAMFSRTPIAAQFRHWVLDVLEERQQATRKAQHTPAPSAHIEDRRALDEWYLITGEDAPQNIQHISVRIASLSMIMKQMPAYNPAWMTLFERMLEEAKDYAERVENSLLKIRHSKTALGLKERGNKVLGL